MCLLALLLAPAAGEAGVKAEYIAGTVAGIAAKSTARTHLTEAVVLRLRWYEVLKAKATRINTAAKNGVLRRRSGLRPSRSPKAANRKTILHSRLLQASPFGRAGRRS